MLNASADPTRACHCIKGSSTGTAVRGAAMLVVLPIEPSKLTPGQGRHTARATAPKSLGVSGDKH